MKTLTYFKVNYTHPDYLDDRFAFAPEHPETGVDLPTHKESPIGITEFSGNFFEIPRVGDEGYAKSLRMKRAVDLNGLFLKAQFTLWASGDVLLALLSFSEFAPHYRRLPLFDENGDQIDEPVFQINCRVIVAGGGHPLKMRQLPPEVAELPLDDRSMWKSFSMLEEPQAYLERFGMVQVEYGDYFVSQKVAMRLEKISTDYFELDRREIRLARFD